MISAKDSDGPRELEFFVQTGDKLVNLSRPTGSSSSGRSVNIILVSPLDRDWVSIFLFFPFLFLYLFWFIIHTYVTLYNVMLVTPNENTILNLPYIFFFVHSLLNSVKLISAWVSVWYFVNEHLIFFLRGYEALWHFPSRVGRLYNFLCFRCFCINLKFSWVDFMFICRCSLWYNLRPDSTLGCLLGQPADKNSSFDGLVWHRL